MTGCSIGLNGGCRSSFPQTPPATAAINVFRLIGKTALETGIQESRTTLLAEMTTLAVDGQTFWALHGEEFITKACFVKSIQAQSVFAGGNGRLEGDNRFW